MSTIALIAALDRGGVIGRDGGLPWHLPADLQRFRRLTLDRPLVVGRRTWVSIGRPLPRRRMVVLSRQADFAAEGVEVVPSWEAARALLATESVVCVGGGEAVFAAALPDAHELWLSRVDALVAGDTYFPPFVPRVWQCVERERSPADAHNEYAHTFERWVRR
jgi:dihydrofolate reductase